MSFLKRKVGDNELAMCLTLLMRFFNLTAMNDGN